MSCYIVEQDVRMYLLDRGAQDNLLDNDYTFATDEIIAAMNRAAREYNSMPPYVAQVVSADRLPNDTNIFLDAIAEQLYIAKLANLARNDFDYDAGGMQVSPDAKRILAFKELIKFHNERWRQPALQLKSAININSFWGQVG